ncbi:MAG: hypothetical protein IIC86_09845, partial [Chloroflexi bacterium]|nr:hypothetical protein [Chloroflexota bacterium]
MSNALLVNGKFTDALDVAKKGLAKARNDRELLQVAAQSYRALGAHKTAIEAARMAIRASSFFNILMQLIVADSLAELHELDAALHEYETVLNCTDSFPKVTGEDPIQQALRGKAIVLMDRAYESSDDQSWRASLNAAMAAI